MIDDGIIRVGSWVECVHPSDKSLTKFIGQVIDMNGLYPGTIYVSCFKYTSVFLRDCKLATQSGINSVKKN